MILTSVDEVREQLEIWVYNIRWFLDNDLTREVEEIVYETARLHAYNSILELIQERI